MSPHYPGLHEWALNGETCPSSRALAAAVAAPRSGPEQYPEPLTFSDVRRCEAMLRAVPTLRDDAMAAARTRMSPTWAVLAGHWGELVARAGDIDWPSPHAATAPPGWGLRFQQLRQKGHRIVTAPHASQPPHPDPTRPRPAGHREPHRRTRSALHSGAFWVPAVISALAAAAAIIVLRDGVRSPAGYGSALTQLLGLALAGAANLAATPALIILIARRPRPPDAAPPSAARIAGFTILLLPMSAWLALVSAFLIRDLVITLEHGSAPPGLLTSAASVAWGYTIVAGIGWAMTPLRAPR